MTSPTIKDAFLLRDVRPADKAEVLEFTANTWEFGDYIEYVFDNWLNDPSGRFLAAEDRQSGRIAAIDKLTFLSPTEAWFEGLRVNPAFRGRGLGAGLQTYMITEAKRLGASTVRFLTNITNQPVQHMAYRDGFSMQSIVRFWKWVEQTDAAARPLDQSDKAAALIRLRRATVEEAPLIYEWWKRSSAHAIRGLLHENWSYKASRLEEWTQRAEDGYLLVLDDAQIATLVLPPPTVLLKPGRSDTGAVAWVISAVTALGVEWEPLMRGLVAFASIEGIAEVNGLLPDTAEVLSGLKEAGFNGEADDERLCLFALDLSA